MHIVALEGASHMVGAVFRPKDLAKGHKSLIENSLRDTNPDIKDGVIDLLNSWEGTTSEQKLKEMIGQERAESLLDRITKKNDKEQKKNNLQLTHVRKWLLVTLIADAVYCCDFCTLRSSPLPSRKQFGGSIIND